MTWIAANATRELSLVCAMPFAYGGYLLATSNISAACGAAELDIHVATEVLRVLMDTPISTANVVLLLAKAPR